MIVSATVTDSRESEIADAVRSVAADVDKVLLVDTGIADRTVERAREVVGDKLVVVKHGWRDFSDARNTSIDVAKTLGAEWVVIVDSDERIDFGALDVRAALAGARAEVLMVESADGFYPKEKILRASSGARFVGPTHEALIGGTRETLRGATFWELAKSREQLERKFRRDAELLTDYLVDHSDDPRWWFYLGQSLEGLGKRARAAEAFGQCVERRRIGDEAAWAAYKQAEQLFMLGQFEAAMVAAGRGLGAHPMYAECAWIAAVAASRLGRTGEAVAWARIAESVGRFRGCGTDRAWFRHLPALYELPYDVLRFTLPDDESRAQAERDFHAAKLARIGAKDQTDLDRICVLRAAPKAARDEARSMLRPPLLEVLCESTKRTAIDFEPTGGRRPTNPSLCLSGGKMWCVVRAVNYRIVRGRYVMDEPDGVVRTDNYLGVLDADCKLTDARPMRDLDPAERKPSLVVGYEDIRLASVGGKLTASATVCDRDPTRRQIARLDLDPEGNIERARIQPSRQWHEKNWMPFALDLSLGGEELAWVYSLDPTVVVLASTGDSAEQLVAAESECPLALGHLRGGAVTRFQDGYLAVAHEVVEVDEGRVYLHRFVKLTERLQVQAASPAWVFAHHGIEFCAGLVHDTETDEIILSYGVDDRQACVARVRAADVAAMAWVSP